MKQKLHSPLIVCVYILLAHLYPLQPTHAQSLTFGQPGIEIGLTIAPMNFLGDLGGQAGKGGSLLKDTNFEFFRLMKGAYITAYPSHYVGVRLAVNSGRLEGHDNVITPKGGLEEARRNRDLGFRSNLFEALLAAEIYPTVLMESDPTVLEGKFRPYLVAGVGMFRFNPQGQYINPFTLEKKWVDLKPLRTEGQGMAEYPDRKEYSLTQVHIPAGIGFKYFINDRFHLGLEFLHRITFTDYIDDVSTNYIDPALFYKYLPADQAAIAVQMSDRENYFNVGNRVGFSRNEGDKRGNKNNDSFFSGGIKFGWRIGGVKSKMLQQGRCPVW